MLIAVVAARALRKRLQGRTHTAAFTLQELREMRNGGRITQEEYEAMRTTIIGQLTADSPTSVSKSSDSQPARGVGVADDTDSAGPDPAPEDEC
jgi:hypothetical protein